MTLDKVFGIFGALIKREVLMWSSGLGVIVIFLLLLNLPLWAYMQVHSLRVDYPLVQMRRTVTLPITLRYREEVETELGFVVPRCDRSRIRPYEWRGLKPVHFKLRCRDLPDGEYDLRVCWFMTRFGGSSMLGCKQTTFKVPGDGDLAPAPGFGGF